jgi:hypothetical protein
MNLNALSELLRACPYPEQMEHIERGILGSGFYPGARGFTGMQVPEGGILLLGRDFGTKTYYAQLCGNPARDETAITWRHTRDIYLACFTGLPVWCTNYLLGVRKNRSSKGNIKSKVASSDWNSFEAYCWKFLQAQVLLQRPRLIVVLGGDNRDDLTSEDRLGQVSDNGLRHSFANGDGTHSVLVTFADHPHSLIPKTRQDVARKIAERLRNLYQSEVESHLSA